MPITKNKGDCYLQAFLNVLKNPSWKFCFGYALIWLVNEDGSINNVQKILHAWAEDDFNVYDFSNEQKIIIPINKYYQERDILYICKESLSDVSWNLFESKGVLGGWCEKKYDELVIKEAGEKELIKSKEFQK